MSDVARAHPNECTACRGRGQTRNCATEVSRDAKTGKHLTVKQGSGCLRCLGTGRLKHQETP